MSTPTAPALEFTPSTGDARDVPDVDPARLYALDIETDNSAGHGLDPRKSSVRSAAVRGGPSAFFLSAVDPTGEARVLRMLAAFMNDLDPGVVVTWNGSNFDLPFLAYRYQMVTDLDPIKLFASEHRPPKYERKEGQFQLRPDHDGGFIGRAFGHAHADIAYRYEGPAKAAGIPWSLKPTAKHLGLTPFETDSTALHETGEVVLAAYNMSDVEITRELGLRLPTLPVDAP